MTIAPASAPISGRVISRARGDFLATPPAPGGGRRGTDVHCLTHTNLRVSGARGGPPRRATPHACGYRVPPSANLPTTSMLDLATINGPVSVGCPPPRMFPLFLYNHRRSTG